MPEKSYDGLLVENSQLRDLVDEYNQMMDTMKSQITELTNDMDQSKCLIQLQSSQERQKEKEMFVKVIKDFEHQRGNNLQELESKCADNVALQAQVDVLTAENDKISKKFEIVNSQLSTKDNIIQEQIRKKKELQVENQDNTSKLNMLFNQLDQAKKQMNEMITLYNVDIKVAENKNLNALIEKFSQLIEDYKLEIKVLNNENQLLKQNIDALNASAMTDNLQVQMLTQDEVAEAKEQESNEVKHLQNIITKCVDEAIAAQKTPQGQSTESFEKVKSAIKDVYAKLRDSEFKLNQTLKSLNGYKLKLNESEKRYLVLKSESSQIELYKKQLDEFIKAQKDGQYFDDKMEDQTERNKIFNKMFQTLKKSKRVFEMQEHRKQNQNQKK